MEKILQGQESDSDGAAEADETIEPPPTPPVESGSKETVTVPATLPPVPAEATPTVQPSVATTPTSVRHFEFVSGASKKFWEISLTDNCFTVRFGRIGTAGQSQTKSFTEATNAKREAESLIAEKLKRGYVEKTG